MSCYEDDILNEESIVDLVEGGLTMKYGRIPHYGLFLSIEDPILIKRGLDKRDEDLTILHEWIHAVEEYYNMPKSLESEVEDYSDFLYSNKFYLVDFIRDFFKEEGF